MAFLQQAVAEIRSPLPRSNWPQLVAKFDFPPFLPTSAIWRQLVAKLSRQRRQDKNVSLAYPNLKRKLQGTNNKKAHSLLENRLIVGNLSDFRHPLARMS